MIIPFSFADVIKQSAYRSFVIGFSLDPCSKPYWAGWNGVWLSKRAAKGEQWGLEDQFIAMERGYA